MDSWARKCSFSGPRFPHKQTARDGHRSSQLRLPSLQWQENGHSFQLNCLLSQAGPKHFSNINKAIRSFQLKQIPAWRTTPFWIYTFWFCFTSAGEGGCKNNLPHTRDTEISNMPVINSCAFILGNTGPLWRGPLNKVIKSPRMEATPAFCPQSSAQQACLILE